MKSLKSILAIFLLLTKISLAQPGKNDVSFNIEDEGLNRGSLVTGIVYTNSIQQDGKIVIGGNFTAVNGVTRFNIARLNPNGILDSSFNVNYYSFGTSNYTARASVIQQDGKIIMAINQNSSSNSEIIRINTDGTLESVLATTNGDVLTMNLQLDGKIVLGGEFTVVGITACQKIVRLNNDGSIDLSFNTGNGVYGTVSSSFIQSDGKILIGGNFSTVNSTTANDIARLNTDGSVDMSFNSGSGVDYYIQSIYLQTDGKILIGGNFTSVNGSLINRIARLNIDGTIDNSFDSGSGIDLSTVWDIKCQPNGKIIVAGNFNTVNNSVHPGIVRFETDGSLDSNFNIVMPNNSVIYKVNFDFSGKLVMGGSFSTVNNVPFNDIVKVNDDGSLDDIFNSGTGATNGIYTISLQTDDRIIVGGNFYSINNAYRTSIARLNSHNGNLDSTFEIGRGAFLNVSSSFVQDDGKIILGGNFSSFNDSIVNRLIRLNSNGFIDTSFNVGSGANGAVTTINVQPDGKILLGGEFSSINSTPMSKITRLNSNGSIDMSFNIGSGFNGYTNDIKLQPDGKILVSGNFTSFNGVSCNRIIRLNEDGTLDGTFNVGSGSNNEIYTIDLQLDGKIILGGSFTWFNVNSAKAIVRLNPDGSTDSGFNLLTFSGSVNTINSIFVMQDGKILIGGLFTNINGIERKNIARLNSDGSVDTTFNPGVGANATVTNLAVQSDGRIIIGGLFTQYNGFKRNRIARLLDCYPVVEVTQIAVCENYFWEQTGLTYYISGAYSDTIPNSNPNGCDSIITLNLTILQSTNTETVTTCDSYTWPINNQTYTTSGQYIDTIPNAAGCDSIITLDLTIIPSLPLSVSNTFSLPSDANACVGELAMNVSGNADFELNLDNGSQIVNTSGYSLINNLCPGVHDLLVTDNCGDTLLTQFVIPVDSNFIFNNPFIDSIAVDSLGSTITNCDIYYNSIDTAYIDSIWATGNTVNVIWNIVDANGSNFDTSSYVLNNGNGVYWLQLSVFCPTKALGDYFTVTEAIYFNNGTISTADLTENTFQFALYPNPTNSEVTLTFDSNEAQLIVYDTQGKLIQTKSIHSGEQVSLKEVETGVYFFEVMTEKGSAVKRVVKN